MGNYRNQNGNDHRRRDGIDERTRGEARAYGREGRTGYDRAGFERAGLDQTERRFDADRRQGPERIYGSSQTALRGGNYDRPAHDASRSAAQSGQRAPERAVQPPRRRSRYDASCDVRDEGFSARGTDSARDRMRPSTEDPRNYDRSRGIPDVAARRTRTEAGDERAQGSFDRSYGRSRSCENDPMRASRAPRMGADSRDRQGFQPDANRNAYRDSRRDASRDASNEDCYSADDSAGASANAAVDAVSNIAGKATSALASLKKGATEAFEPTGSIGKAVASWAKNANESSRKRAAQEKVELEREATSTAGTGVDELKLGEQKIRELAFWRSKASKTFSGILTAGLVIGLLFFLRPSVSQAENRELTKFPSFSITSFVDGTWTEGISTWYADTYPFRDQLIAVSKAMKGLYGFESSTQMYGTAAQGDEIPDEAKKQTTKKNPISPETYDSWNLEADIQGQIMEGLYVDNGTVYATYGFTQEAADDYIAAVNGAAEKLDGTTQVYSILIPNNSGVLLSKDELAALGGSNQGQAIQYYYDSYNDKVKTIPTMKPLVDHKGEYIYFRTDHHWTSLAAYYVYQVFCQTKGIQSNDIASFQEKDFSPFLGSYYSQLQLESLEANPDTVQAWIPKGTNDMKYTDVDGNTIDWNVIKDVSEWDQGTQYNCFVGGDQPWAEIHNPNITDGSSCLVVKESYGNAFVPWLVDNYQDVYIVDFRYNNDNVVDICKEKGVNDLILLNNISIIGSVDVAGKIASIL